MCREFVTFVFALVILTIVSQHAEAKKPKDGANNPNAVFSAPFVLKDGNGDTVGRIIDFNIGDLPFFGTTNFTESVGPLQKFGTLLHVLIPFEEGLRLFNFHVVQQNAFDASGALVPMPEIVPISYFLLYFDLPNCFGFPFLGMREVRFGQSGVLDDGADPLTLPNGIQEAILFERNDIDVFQLYRIIGPKVPTDLESVLVPPILNSLPLCFNITINNLPAFPLELQEFDLFDLFPRPYSIEIMSTN